jgi:hypothetical protein
MTKKALLASPTKVSQIPLFLVNECRFAVLTLIRLRRPSPVVVASTTITQVGSTGIPTANLRDDALDHDVAGSRFRANATKRPFDPHSAGKMITCSGGEYNYHPSGQHVYTDCEFASLQTFCLDFQLHNRNTKKQIGNAIPPKLAQVIYQAIIELLQETDARELCEEQERQQNPLIID